VVKMNIDEYQTKASETAIYPAEYAIVYPALGLNGEAGEVAEKVKKYIRDDGDAEKLREDLRKELGDVLWYVAATASDAGLKMSDIAETNLGKLKSRSDRDKIGGSGDDR